MPDPQHWGSAIYHDDNMPMPSPTPTGGNGVIMADGYITASYNALNQPVGMWSQVYSGTSNYMWFGYDPLGRCVKRWKGPASAGTPGYNPATYFYYDGSDIVEEGPGAASTDRVYVHGGRVDEIVASWVSGNWYNHHYDAQGNCILLSTTSGTIQEQYDYDAFGYPYFYTPSGGKGGNVKTRFLFTGREWISDMRIYDYRARMYQPELGRFLQPDPKEFEAGDYNLYRYCHNDPVNKSDPTGLREQAVGETHRDIMWDLARYMDGSNTEQGSFANFTDNAYMGAIGDGGADGRRYTMAQTSQVGPAPARNQPGKPDYAIRSIGRAYMEKEGDTYYAHVFWKIQLFHYNQKPLGAGIEVGEKIEWSNKVDFKAKDHILGKFPTRDDGSVSDPWKLPFSSKSGSVTTTQTIYANGREAKWDATVRADGTVVNPQHYAPFTEPSP